MKLIWSSSLDRGIENLLHLYPLIKKEYPTTTLDIFYGWGSWFNEGERKAFKDSVMNQIASLPGVAFHGRVGQDVLHEAQKKADVWLYPTAFHETYCITAVECQLYKTLCVSTHLAGLIDTISDRGILINGDPTAKQYRETILKELFSIWEDKPRLNKLLERGYSWAKQQTWTNRAKEWQSLFSEEIK